MDFERKIEAWMLAHEYLLMQLYSLCIKDHEQDNLEIALLLQGHAMERLRKEFESVEGRAQRNLTSAAMSHVNRFFERLVQRFEQDRQG